jgi:hypothetical protein
MEATSLDFMLGVDFEDGVKQLQIYSIKTDITTVLM